MSGQPPVTPIDLTQFAEIVDNARTDNASCLVATSNDGWPDAGLKGSVMVWDKDHVAWWERTLRETYAAVQRNPKVCVFCRNPVRDRRTIRMYGSAEIVSDAALRERIWDRVVDVEKEMDKEKKGQAVLVRVDRVRVGIEDAQRRS
jgi:uncharacterized pyridoxamine 5'-phosphate oxidase family protein